MNFKQEPLEAGIEDVEINIKSRLEIYIGQVREAEDCEGNKVLCVVTEISKVYINNGKLTFDAKMMPQHLISDVDEQQ